MSKIISIYHDADMDGLCCGAIARKALGSTSQYLGWDYGRDVPDLSSYDTIYLMDLSFPTEIMAKYADKIVWIDHHRSAMKSVDEWEVK